MKFLLVVKQEKNAGTFLGTVRRLVEREHQVTLSIQERDDARDRHLAEQIGSERFAVVPCPPARIDEWSSVAPLVRRLRDCFQYARPPFSASAPLQTRIVHKLLQELGIETDTERLTATLRALPARAIERLVTVTRLAERSLPTSPLFDEFLQSQRPDVLLVSPLVHFGSAQADLVASARRLGIPIWMLLFSWDNLSTKGCLHVQPDLMFVWNEQQRAEAEQLHGFPASRVVVVGAPRFDAFFALRPALTREQFHAPLGLDAAKPTLLYLCSSPLIAPRELDFVRRWVAAVRTASSPVVRDANVIVRPHPDIALLPEETPFERQRWPGVPALDSSFARPFADGRAVVLRTSVKDPNGLYETLVHSSAVVGLNTTAELEAGIVGRPVFTIAPGADAQQATLHFHYLTREHGGFVSVARDLEDHLAQLQAALAGDADQAAIRSFVQGFLRPHGLDRPVSPLLADALERHAATPFEPAAPTAVAAEAEVLTGERPADAVLPLAYKRGRLVVHATASARRQAAQGAVSLDPRAVAWLEHHVGIGDIVYEVNAGFGPYALIAARQRGAVVVAFEAGYRAYGELCENVLLNGCQATVVPVPLALADADGLADMKYERDQPGGERYSVRPTEWRLRPEQGVRPYVQPACAARLDTVIDQYRLPAPNHLRISRHAAALDVLRGATRTLGSAALRTVWVRVAPADERALEEFLAAYELEASDRSTRASSVQLEFRRRAAAAAALADGHASKGLPA